MIFQDYLPNSALREYVKCYHLRHFVFYNDMPVPFKPYAPRPEQTLAFYPRDPEFVEYVSSKEIIQRPRSMIMGQYTVRTNRHVGGRDWIALFVDFQPGVLHRITGIPYHELTNTFIDAESVFSKEIRLVNERLNSTDCYNEIIEIVETFLLMLMQKSKKDFHPIDKATNLIIEHPECASIEWFAKEACLCPRQFERKFKERMGINPKLFARIARLKNAVRMKNNCPGEDWLSIALACGYYDYQHLVKDCQEFTGVAPTAYFLQDTKSAEKVFGLSDTSY